MPRRFSAPCLSRVLGGWFSDRVTWLRAPEHAARVGLVEECFGFGVLVVHEAQERVIDAVADASRESGVES